MIRVIKYPAAKAVLEAVDLVLVRIKLYLHHINICDSHSYCNNFRYGRAECKHHLRNDDTLTPR